MNILQQFVNFLLNQRPKPSLLTVKNYKADIGQFLNWFEKEFKSPFDPSKATIQMLQNYKKTKNLSESSMKRHSSSLHKFFNFLRIQKLIDFEMLPTSERKVRIKADPWMIVNFRNFLHENRRTNITIKNYINDVKSFFVWLGEVALSKYSWNIEDNNLLDKINSPVIEEYKQRLISAKFSPRTINRKLSSLRSYIGWAKSQGLISSSRTELAQALQSAQLMSDSPKQAEDVRENNQKEKAAYSSFPPQRLVQKSTKGIVSLFDNLFILPLAQALETTQYLLWRATDRKIFKKNVIIESPHANQSDEISNIKKEFYSPLDVSIRYLPAYKRIWHYIRYVRPNWYKTYHSYSFTHYFHFAILMTLSCAIGFGAYSNFFATNEQRGNGVLGAATSAPPRILSFQGQLADSSETPITKETSILFSLYDNENASTGAALWRENDIVKPNSDGFFSILLGKKTSISDSIFSQNSRLFLGITVGNSSELRPRQELATVPFASNSNTLQGLEPITNSTKVSNVVLALDSSGNLNIAGTKAHTFQTIGGNLILSGKVLSLITAPGSNSNVEIVPNGTGTIDLTKPIQNSTNNNNLTSAVGSVEFDDTVAILATSSSQAAFYINQNSTGPLISANTNGVAKFIAGYDGSGTFVGDLSVNGGDITSTAITFNLLNSTVTTLNLGSAATTINLGVSGGNTTVRSNLILSSLSSNGGILYTNGSGNVFEVPAGSSSQCLIGGTTPSFATCSGANAPSIVNQDNGALYLTNTTVDVLFGGTGTSSAKFGFLNVNSGTPTASVSGTTGATYLTSDGAIATTNNQQLILGGATTGNIILSPLNGLGTVTFSGLSTGIAHFNSWGVISSSAVNLASSDVSGILPTGNGGSWWNSTLGALYPGNNTIDLLIGGTSTTSAKFGFINVSSGTPTASIAGNLSLNGAGLTHTFNILDNGTLNFQKYPSGDGDNNSSVMFLNNNGNVGIGTTNPGQALSIVGNITDTGQFLGADGSVSSPGFSFANETNSGWYYIGSHNLGMTINGTQVLDFAGVGPLQMTFRDDGNLRWSSTGNPQNAPDIGISRGVAGKLYVGNGTQGDYTGTLIAGNIGIGTTAPTALLDVNGTASVSALTIRGSSPGYINQINGNSLIFRTSVGGTAVLNEVMTISNSGNIGIGTTSPLAKLDVRGLSGTSPAASMSAQSSFASLIIDNSGAGDLFTASKSGSTKFTITNAGGIQLGLNTGTSAQCLLGGVTASWGSCGTGTGSNWNLNSANGTLSPNISTLDLLIGGTGTNSAKFAILNMSSGTPVASIAGNLSLSGTSLAHKFNILDNGTLNFQRYPSGDTANGSSLLYLGNNDNVGIGTTAPTALLDVNGTASISALTIRGSSPGYINQINGNSLIFRTSVGGTTALNEVMTISNSGKVGIGTTMPAAGVILDANGVINAATGYRIANTATSGNYLRGNGTNFVSSGIQAGDIPALTYVNNASDSTLTRSGIGPYTLGINLGNTNSWSGAQTFANNTYFPESGIWNASGRVGIGTTNPGYKLEVHNGNIMSYNANNWQVAAASNTVGSYLGAIDAGPPGTPVGEVGTFTNNDFAIVVYNNEVMRTTTTGRVGIGTTNPSYQLELSTNSAAKPTSSAWTIVSDLRLKGNITPFADGLSVLKQLNPVSYTLNGKGGTPAGAKGIGFIAQDIKDIIPYTVGTFKAKLNPGDTQETELYNFDSSALTFVLINAIKEQQQQITSQGDLLVSQSSALQNLQDTSSTSNILNNIEEFLNNASANIKAGLLQASDVITNSLIVTSDSIIVNGQSLRDYIVSVIRDSGFVNSDIISPTVSTNQLATNIISPLSSPSLIIKLATPSGSLIVENANGSAVARIDDQGNARFAGDVEARRASFSGTINSNALETNNASISGTLRAKNIIADSIEGLDARVSSIAADAIFSSKYLMQAINPIDLASYSAQLSYVPDLAAERAQFNQGLLVFGPTSLADLAIAGKLSIGGTLFVSENSIETLGTDLSLQSLRQGGLSIMGGLIYIDTEGNIKVQGDLSITGKLAVNVISPLPTSDLVINNASGSSVLSISQTGNIVASGSGTFSKLNFNLIQPVLAVSATEVIASSSAGVTNIAPYQSEVTIKNAFVTDKSVIYITPVGTPSAQAPFLMRQTPQESFTVGVQSPTNHSLPFNWLIIN